MSQRPISTPIFDILESRDKNIPSMPHAIRSGITRFLSKTYVVEGNAYARFANALVKPSYGVLSI